MHVAMVLRSYDVHETLRKCLHAKQIHDFAFRSDNSGHGLRARQSVHGPNGLRQNPKELILVRALLAMSREAKRAGLEALCQ